MALRQVLSTYAVPIGLGLGLLWALARRRSQTGHPVDTNDPIWTTAIASARATVGEMRRLHAQYGSDVYVKFPLAAKNGQIEHVWGPLLDSTKEPVQVGLATPPVGGLKSEPPFAVGCDELEDWQLVLPDGKVRGGFTTQAQIALARRGGWPVPHNVRHMEGKFVDALPVAT